MNGQRIVLAVDLGGTKLACAAVNGRGELLAERRAPIEKAGLAETMRQVAEAGAGVLKSAGLAWEAIHAAGIIVPGIFDARTGNAWAPNLWGLDEAPLAEEAARVLPVASKIDSDRAGYVLGEQWLGVAQGLSDVVFLAVGTGIGAGIISGGRLIRGAGGIAGAVGWFALNPQLEDIYRQTGCWESESAGPGVARKAGFDTAELAVAAARSGDSQARLAIEEAADYLAMGIANIVSILNPEMVVLGGGLMTAGDLFLPRIRERVGLWAQPVAIRRTRIELSALGGRAGLLGAARLALAPEQL